MHDGDLALIPGAGRHVRGQPFHQPVHLFNGLGDGGDVLLAPASNLAVEVVARLAVVGQAPVSKLHGVQRGNHAVHFVVDGTAFGRRHAGQGLVPQHATLHALHHVEGAANHRFVFAQHMHAGHGHIGALQAAHHGEFALDGVGRRQQLGHWAGLGTHHVAGAGRDELVGGVGLPAFEHLDGQGPFKAWHVATEPAGERGNIEGVLFGHRACAHEVVKVAHVRLGV